MVRLTLSAVAVLLVSAHAALACLNTSYSRKEEKQITCTLTELIAGQFPEHGEAFYLHQMEVQTARLKKVPGDVEARNDLAAALIKLKIYDEAEKELLRIEREQPGRYKTHANLGVLYKKTGDYAKAAEHTRKALEIKPEGHLGLGDYYLRMLEWRAKSAAGDPSARGRNFLGIRYDAGPEATAASPLVNREHLMTLIRADRHFADAYVVLGDVLFVKGDLQHAIRAYTRAGYLLEDKPSEETSHVYWRINLIEERWQEQAAQSDDLIFDRHYQGQISREFDDAERWLNRFQITEASLLKEGAREVDFAGVQAEMENVYPGGKLEYIEAGLYEGEEHGSGTFSSVTGNPIAVVMLLGAGGVLAAAIVVAIVRAGKVRQPA